MSFSDYRTALVTGASSGIGAAVVERLRAEKIEVHAIARSADALNELAERTGCIAHVIDVTNRAAIAALAGSVQFDILVNNAGVDRPKSSCRRMPRTSISWSMSTCAPSCISAG